MFSWFRENENKEAIQICQARSIQGWDSCLAFLAQQCRPTEVGRQNADAQEEWRVQSIICRSGRSCSRVATQKVNESVLALLACFHPSLMLLSFAYATAPKFADLQMQLQICSRSRVSGTDPAADLQRWRLKGWNLHAVCCHDDEYMN